MGNAGEQVISALRILNSLQLGISLNFVRVRIALNERDPKGSFYFRLLDSIVGRDFFSNSLLVEGFKRTIGERWKIFSPRFEWWRAEENVHQGIFESLSANGNIRRERRDKGSPR